jgi:hypothetical protein
MDWYTVTQVAGNVHQILEGIHPVMEPRDLDE